MERNNVPNDFKDWFQTPEPIPADSKEKGMLLAMQIDSFTAACRKLEETKNSRLKKTMLDKRGTAVRALTAIDKPDLLAAVILAHLKPPLSIRRVNRGNPDLWGFAAPSAPYEGFGGSALLSENRGLGIQDWVFNPRNPDEEQTIINTQERVRSSLTLMDGLCFSLGTNRMYPCTDGQEQDLPSTLALLGGQQLGKVNKWAGVEIPRSVLHHLVHEIVRDLGGTVEGRFMTGLSQAWITPDQDAFHTRIHSN